MRSTAILTTVFLAVFLLVDAGAEGRRIRADAQVYFSPGGGAGPAVEKAIRSAKSEILVAMYMLSSPKLSRHLIAAHKRGVDVKVLLDDKENMKAPWSKAKALEKEGVFVRYIRPKGQPKDPVPAKFHHKFAVVDRTLVLTGSFNWSNMADTSNHEDLLVLRSPALATRYVKVFEKAQALGRARGK